MLLLVVDALLLSFEPVLLPASLEGFDSVVVDALEVDSFFPGFTDEYRSAYQPPPFKMKRPPLIWRFAVCSWHFGHS